MTEPEVDQHGKRHGLCLTSERDGCQDLWSSVHGGVEDLCTGSRLVGYEYIQRDLIVGVSSLVGYRKQPCTLEEPHVFLFDKTHKIQFIIKH